TQVRNAGQARAELRKNDHPQGDAGDLDGESTRRCRNDNQAVGASATDLSPGNAGIGRIATPLGSQRRIERRGAVGRVVRLLLPLSVVGCFAPGLTDSVLGRSSPRLEISPLPDGLAHDDSPPRCLDLLWPPLDGGGGAPEFHAQR